MGDNGSQNSDTLIVGIAVNEIWDNLLLCAVPQNWTKHERSREQDQEWTYLHSQFHQITQICQRGHWQLNKISGIISVPRR